MRDIGMKKGDIVERNLEGMWFQAVIQEISLKDKLLTLKYLDDGNTENYVPFEETRKSTNINGSTFIRSPSKKDTLMRPLAGLVEDDYESRNLHQPTVVVHNSTNDHGAIILNGAENKLAAGGGLRALRYLKK